MTRWMPSPIAVIAMRTESTRKGMSSVTIWTTVCADCQPFATRSGLKTWTLAVARGPDLAQPEVGERGAQEVAGLVGLQVERATGA